MALIYIIIGISVGLYLLRFYDDIAILIVKIILFYALCALEICYLLTREDYNWFFDYNQIGILKMLVGFIILTAILFNQYGVWRILLHELSPHEQGINYDVGLYSYILAIIGTIICAFFLDSKHIVYIMYFLFAAQLIQVILIFHQSRPYWKIALCTAFTYLLGTISFIIILYHYAAPFAIATVLIAAFYFAISVAKTALNRRDY